MTNFVTHEPCPECGSRDNLGVWSDGHKWCFGCGYYVPSEANLKTVEEYFFKKEELVNTNLPSDVSVHIPPNPYRWLTLYGLTMEEIVSNHLLWSEKEEMLIFPYGTDNHIDMWQGRYFPIRKRKCYTAGKAEDNLLFPYTSNNELSFVVAVEDPVSAIKVGRHAPATPLLGSFLSKQKAIRLSKMFDRLVIWLDMDKTQQAITLSNMYGHLFKDGVTVVATTLDPKECTDKLIRDKLNI